MDDNENRDWEAEARCVWGGGGSPSYKMRVCRCLGNVVVWGGGETGGRGVEECGFGVERGVGGQEPVG